MTEMEQILVGLGFIPLESSTRCWGIGTIPNTMTGSIELVKGKKILEKYDKDDKDAKQIFCPFISDKDERKPNHVWRTVRLKNAEEIINYLKNEKAWYKDMGQS